MQHTSSHTTGRQSFPRSFPGVPGVVGRGLFALDRSSAPRVISVDVLGTTMFDQLVRARHHRRFAFTLIELIAVVVVLSVLSALEVPTFERVRTETRASVAERVLDGIANDAIALSGFDTGQMTFATIDTALSELNDGSGVSWNVVEQASQAAYAAARR